MILHVGCMLSGIYDTTVSPRVSAYCCVLQFRVVVDVVSNVTSCAPASIPITTLPYGGLWFNCSFLFLSVCLYQSRDLMIPR